MNERIKVLLEKLNLTASRFADEIGVPRSTISHIISGRNKPSLDFITKIIDRFNSVNIEWVIFGHGEVFKDAKLKSGEMDDDKIDKYPTQPENKTQHSTFEEQEKQSSDSFSNTIPFPEEEESPKSQKSERIKEPDDEKNTKSVEKQTKTPVEEIQTTGQLSVEIERIVIFYKNNTFTEYVNR